MHRGPGRGNVLFGTGESTIRESTVRWRGSKEKDDRRVNDPSRSLGLAGVLGRIEAKWERKLKEPDRATGKEGSRKRERPAIKAPVG